MRGNDKVIKELEKLKEEILEYAKTKEVWFYPELGGVNYKSIA